MSFIRDSLSVFFTRILLFPVGIIGGIIIARVLGPTNKGILAILVLLPTLLVSIGHLGIGNANLYFIGKNRFPFQSILSNSLSLSIILGSVLISICVVTVIFLKDSIFKGIDPVFIILSVSAIPFSLLIKYASYIFLGKQMIRERNLVNIMEGLFCFICIVAFVLIFKWGIKGALIATLGGLLIASLYCLYCLREMGNLTLHLDFLLFKQSVFYGIKPYLALVILSLNYRLDLFLVKYFLTDAHVGYYSLAVSIAEKLWFFPSAIGIVLYSNVASLSEHGANELTPKACRNALFASFMAGVVLFWAGKFLIPLFYGNAFLPSVRPFMILLPGVLAMTIYIVLHSDLAGRGRPEITIYVFSGALVLNIILNMLLIPRLGIEGAALASTISYSLGALILSYIFSNVSKVRLSDILIVKKGDFENYLAMYSRLTSKMRYRLLGNRSI